jgi:formylglycine-generating enzyme required for sulfatase activity
MKQARRLGLAALVVVVVGALLWATAKRWRPSIKAPDDRTVAQHAADAPCPPGMARIPGGAIDGVNVWSFCLGVTEVTVGAWNACVAAGHCPKASATRTYRAGYAHFVDMPEPACNGDHPDRLDHPLNCVNFDQATNFCARDQGRLPTDAEWRWAAKGARAGRFPWGDAPPDESRVCFSPGPAARTGTCPVGMHPAGASLQGLFDLAGNVEEWTVNGEDSPRADSGAHGGAYDAVGSDPLGAEARHGFAPAQRSARLGFRCAR